MLLDKLQGLFTFQTFDDSATKASNLVKTVHGSLDANRALLDSLNSKGAGVFFTVNTTDLMGRKADNITRVRAVFIDLDDPDPQRTFDYFLPPSVVVESSPGKHQVYWILADELPLSDFKRVQSALATLFRSDPKINDLSRVMRVPGFYHSKGKPFLVRELISTDHIYTAAQIEDFISCLDLIGSAPTSTTEAPRILPAGCTADSFGESRLNQLLYELSLAYEGDRNNTLNRVAFAGWGLVKGGHLSEAALVDALITGADGIGIREAEARATLRSAKSKAPVVFDPLDSFDVLPPEVVKPSDFQPINWLVDIQNTRPDWLWKGYLCRSSLHLIVGKGGVGKTNIAINLAAIVSSGGKFPDGTSAGPPAKVLYFTTEDDVAMTVRPRLQAAGANLANVGIINQIQTPKGLQHFDPAQHMDLVARLCLLDNHNVGLVVIDPIVSAVTGDHNKNEEVRRGLEPVLRLSKALRCAVLGVSHLGKGKQGVDPNERVLGSSAFVNVARITLFAMTTEDADGNIHRHFVKGKSNITSQGGGFSYHLDIQQLPDVDDVTTVRWGPYDARTAADIAEQTDQDRDEVSSYQLAKQFLVEALAEGTRSASRLEKEAKELHNISRATLYKAKRDLGVLSDCRGLAGGGRTAEWSLPFD